MTVVGAQWGRCEVGRLLVPFSELAQFRKCYLNAVEPVCVNHVHLKINLSNFLNALGNLGNIQKNIFVIKLLFSASI